MSKKSLMVITVEESPQLTLEELCHATGVSSEFIQEAINFGILDPRGVSMENWHFDAMQLQRLRTVIHLQQDLEVNLAGAALVLDLLQQMEEMRTQMDVFEKHFSSFYQR